MKPEQQAPSIGRIVHYAARVPSKRKAHDPGRIVHRPAIVVDVYLDQHTVDLWVFWKKSDGPQEHAIEEVPCKDYVDETTAAHEHHTWHWPEYVGPHPFEPQDAPAPGPAAQSAGESPGKRPRGRKTPAAEKESGVTPPDLTEPQTEEQ